MANYNTLKTDIQSVIRQNDNNEITGQILQQSLLSMVNSLGAGYQYMGVATPTTNPGEPDQKVFYIAQVNGTYTHFNSINVNRGEVCILKYDTAWQKELITSNLNSYLPETYFEGNGIYLVGNEESQKHRIYDVLPNQSYRIWILNPDVDMTGITAGARFVVRLEKEDGTYTEESEYSADEELPDFVDITTNADTKNIYIGGRCAVGSTLKCALSKPEIEYVRFDVEQSLTSEQKERVQTNIGLGGVNKDVEKLTKLQSLQLNGLQRNLINESHEWVRYSDGARFGTSGDAYSAILPLNGEKKIDVFVGKDGGLSVAFAAIAFYSDETPSTSSYISASSVQYQTGVDWYSATIPDNAKIAVITYTHAEGYIVFTDGSCTEYVDGKVEGVKNEINKLLVRAKFVKNAWVRYSDGHIVESAGARLFRLNKADIGQATKIIAKIAPNNPTFAAIAFYSGEPSEATYMQSISVVSNYPDTEDSVYEINVPSEDWVCALFTDQYAVQPNPEIYANATPSGVSTEYVDNKIEESKVVIYDRVSPLKNIFDFKPLYHHLNQESVNPTIPAQSLLDIAFAKQLGFDMIEANPHPCSDGVILCKHGYAGQLGAGLIFAEGSTLNASTPFSSVTSTQIRNDVSYDSIIEKYKGGHIPTLDEFAAECKKYQLRIKLAWIPGMLDILRKYLTDDMIWITTTIRPSGFRGCIEYICNSPSDIDASIAACKIIGAPVNIVIASGTEGQYTDAKITELVTKAHNNGFTVGMVYPTSNSLAKHLPMGIDVFGSTSGQTNFIDIGNEININRLDDTKISYFGGSSYDSTNDVINMPVDSTISVPENIPIIMGQCGVRVRFNGKIEIVVGNEGGYYRGLTAESNDVGEAYLNLTIMATDSYPTHDRWVNITAKEESTIYSLSLAGSRL